MSQHTYESLDRVCEELRALAKERGDTRITVDVRADGRVTIEGYTNKGWTSWHADADLRDGGALPMPSAALCDEVKKP